MPELPDVEVFRRYLDATALHQRIEEVAVRNSRVLEGVSAGRLQETLEGSRLSSTRRHGKYLLVSLELASGRSSSSSGGTRSGDGGTRSGDADRPLLVLHFGMTGYLKYFKEPQGEDSEPALRHERVSLRFANGYRLAYLNQRLLGSVLLVDDLEDLLAEKELGPDALELDLESFAERVRRGRGSLKSTLMNQSLLAGIGNIYSDEILFQARLHPRAEVRELDDGTIRRLHGKLRHVLERAIEAKANPAEMPRSWLLPQREEGKPCPRCGGRIRKTKVSGRSAYFCPDCQKGGPS